MTENENLSRREALIEIAKYTAAFGAVGAFFYEVYRLSQNTSTPPAVETATIAPTDSILSTGSEHSPLTASPSAQPALTEKSGVTPAQKIETVTPVPLAEKFKLGAFDPSTTPFSVETSSQLTINLGYIFTGSLKYKVTKPERIDTPYITDKIQGIFDGTAVDNSWGNPGATALTDKSNIHIELVHSMEPGAPGELCRILGSFIIKNPDKINNILGQQIIITPDGATPITAVVADVRNVRAEDFSSISTPGSFWDVDGAGDNVIYFKTDAAGIPAAIRNDNTQEVYYLILASCTPGNGDFWQQFQYPTKTMAEISNHNTEIRTMLTLQFLQFKA